MGFIAAIPIIGQALESIFSIIDKVVPDRDLAEKLKHETTLEMMKADIELQKGQQDINKIEAASSSIFVAGWRPFIGWMSGVALFWHFMGYDIAQWVVALSGSKVVVPQLGSVDYLFEIVLAMLGIAGMRTFEKVKGVNNR
jgi:hypothetical protein